MANIANWSESWNGHSMAEVESFIKGQHTTEVGSATLTTTATTLTGAVNELDGETDTLTEQTEQLSDDVESIVSGLDTAPDYDALPLLCGQPPILYGAGTPQESVVPTNWNQFDPETGEGYNWTGSPSAEGQQYINTSASSNGRYIAVKSGYSLTWKNL